MYYGKDGSSSIFNDSVYFGADTPDKLISYLERKSSDWFNCFLENEYLTKILRSWDAYHGIYYSEGHKISYGGEQGEYIKLAVNHYRNIAKNMHSMVTANRPAFQARAANTDSKSEIQTNLANSLLEYYMREKRLEKYLLRAVEYAIALGSGYIKLGWNATSGEIYDYVDPKPEDPDQKSYPIYEGDLEVRNLSPLDIVYDSTKETFEENDWLLVRTFKNKFDLAAKYPELADKIIQVKTKSEKNTRRITLHPYDATVDIAVYEFLHRPTEALPNGRYVIFLDFDEELVLIDTVLPYKDLGIYRISPSDFLGTGFGYTPMFDLLPIQDAVNSLYSAVLTNQNAFAIQSILNPRGNDVTVHQVTSGMNFIEYNQQVGAPQALQLTASPKEVFDNISMLERGMELISGVNSVARGNPEASLKSGTALALVQAQALQFMNGLQQSYTQLIEDVGSGIISLLKEFAKVPRVAAIVGVNQKSNIQEFTGDDLDLIDRVLVDVGNPLATTTAGRVQMAEQMLQMGAIDSPEKYLEVINTGKITSLTENQSNTLAMVRQENEDLLKGLEVQAMYSDKHSLHIREHRAIIDDLKLRRDNPELIRAVANHMQEHIDLLRNTDPAVLAIFGEQALSPVGGTPNAPMEAPSMEGGNPEEVMTPEQPMQPSPNSQLPQPATAPTAAPNGQPTFAANTQGVPQNG